MSSFNRGTFLCTAFLFLALVSAVYLFQERRGSVWGGIAGKRVETTNGGGETKNVVPVVAHEQQHHVGDNDKDDDVFVPKRLSKYPFMATPQQIADEDRICFVHVGKTAGSTMACALGFTFQDCPVDHIVLPKGHLPNFTTSMIHEEYNLCQHHNIAMFLFVVRNPLTRMQSWFTYERPVPGQRVYNKEHYASKVELFVDCPFPTLDALGGPKGLGAGNATHCSRDAWRAITGTRGFSVHNYHNYRRYFDQVLQQTKDPRIIVLRTEHLEQDWRSIELDVLDGPEPFDESFTFYHKNKSVKEEKDKYLSDESTANICRALCEEIQVYKQILIQAENLDDSDFVESMKELSQYCPVQAERSECD